MTTNPNSDAWTTLPEADTDGAGDADTSLTTQGTGESCPEGLSSDLDAPHPFLNHYWNADGECGPQGTTGAWHAFTGSSGGWTDWTVDLSQYAGKKIDIRLSAVTDWGTLGLGTWIDDLRLSDGNTTLESNDFETDTGTGWTIGPPPAGTDNPTNGWNRRTKEFQEGGVVTTNDTVLTGFGFEGINETARNEFMKRTLTHLGVLSAPPPSGSNTGTVDRRRHGSAGLRGRCGAAAGPGAGRRPRGAGQAREREDQVEPQPAGRPARARQRARRVRGRRRRGVPRRAAARTRVDRVRLEAVHDRGR